MLPSAISQKRLPKGHEVLAWYPATGMFIDLLNEENISYEQEGDVLVIKGFVSGDTEEKGLSIVALDNVDYCIFSGTYKGHRHICMTDEEFDCFKNGVAIHPRLYASREEVIRELNVFGMSPTCSFR